MLIEWNKLNNTIDSKNFLRVYFGEDFFDISYEIWEILNYFLNLWGVESDFFTNLSNNSPQIKEQNLIDKYLKNINESLKSN